jgi:dihydroflavonol-4-reductase
MNVLVTGSTGFIGSQLCRALIVEGHAVRAFHRNTSMLRLLESLPVEHVVGDISQLDSLVKAMQDVELVFHTAGLVAGLDDPGRMYAVNVEGTRNVLQAARTANVCRVIYTSSVAALGVPPVSPRKISESSLLDENHTWNYLPQRWTYGYTKYLAELEVQKAVGQGLDVVTVNPSIVTGAGDIYRQSSSLIVQVANRRLPALTEGGLNIIHIEDVVQGHLAAARAGRRGRRYILAGENLSIVDFVRKIASVTGTSAPRLILPASLVRNMATPLRLLNPYIHFPIEPAMLNLAGCAFFYTNRRAQVELGLPQVRPASIAIAEAYAWFMGSGSVTAASPAG